MSTKKSKQKCNTYHKKNSIKKENAKDQKNNVLVLPPDLLQKLGINLENIQTMQHSSLEKKSDTCNKLDQVVRKMEASELQHEIKNICNEEKESSILETANLMKASVFLSPTFSSFKPNNILGMESNSETCIEEVMAKSTENFPYEEQKKHYYNKYEFNADNMKCINIQINDHKNSICEDETQSNSIKPISKNIDSIVPVEASSYSLENEHIVSLNENKYAVVPINTIISNNIKISKKNDSTLLNIEHQCHNEKIHQNINHSPTKNDKRHWNKNFEKEKHDSNSNICSKDHDAKLDNIIASKVTCVYGEVIKMAEEVLDNNSNNFSSQDENVKIKSSLDKNLKLKDPTVEGKCDKDISVQDNQEIQAIACSSLYLPLKLDCKNNIQNTQSSAMSSEENNSYDSYAELYDTQEKRKKICKSDNCQISNDVDTNSSNCAKQNSFTMCQEVINNKDVPPSPTTFAEVLLGNIEENIHFSQPCTTVQNSLTKNINTTGNPKLCIQGVEKPGGVKENVNLNRNIKTYSRLHHPKLTKTISGLISHSKYNIDSDINYKINDQNLPTTICTGTRDLHDFCLCQDFGNFINYNVDNSYEHIHFWNRKEAQCSVETLLSIYEDNDFEDKFKKDNIYIPEVEDIDKENLELSDDSAKGICWSYTDTTTDIKNLVLIQQNLQSIVAVEGIFNKKEHIDYAETASNKSKRKRADKTSESESDCEKPSTKKATISIKCGVCKYEVSKNEWDNHIISKEHYFIAQREGQEIKAGKSSDITEHTGIGIEVKKLQILEVPASQIMEKQVTNVQELQIKKQNAEVQIEIVEKPLIRETAFQVIIDENQVVEQPILQAGTQKLVSEMPALQGETEQKQIAIFEAQIVDQQVPVLPVLQVKVGMSGVQVETSKKDSVLQVESTETQVPEIFVSQLEKGGTNVTCGVCSAVVGDSLWIEHITQKHNYIAWKDDEPPLDSADEDEIRNYLNHVIKEIGELVCNVCGLKRKFAKSYLKHIKNCRNVDDEVLEQTPTPVVDKTENIDTGKNRKVRAEKNNDEDMDNTKKLNIENIEKVETEKIKKARESENMSVNCGVCKVELKNAQWIKHIMEEHDYLAWKEGDPEVDLNDSQQIYDHLFKITKQNDGLTCKKCGLNRRYVKSYLKHIETCDGGVNDTLSESILDTTTVDTLIRDLAKDEDAKCGVCKIDVEGKHWFDHVHLCHAYLAWKEGKTALDLDNEEEIQSYLYLVSKKYNGLVCNKCGLNRKYVKVYLSHLESCNSNLLDASMIAERISNKDSYQCAVCSETVDINDWSYHVMKVHYNLAWAVGNYPIDTKNVSIVEKQLKAYKQKYGKFKCNVCNTIRVSPMGFYAHILQCGKTEEEIDEYKIFCELCNSKYLCIYKSQHAIMHRELEHKERKLHEQTQKDCVDTTKTDQPSERRRAAEKARQFIEQSETFTYKCSKCDYGADDQAELDEHVCSKIKYKAYIDSEESEISGSSDDESLDSDVDSNLSAEEALPDRGRKKGCGESGSAATKVQRIPFAIKCAKSFLRQSADDYRNVFLTNRVLYPQWQNCNIELVADDQTSIYLPTLKESCKVIIGRRNPETYKQFETKNNNGYSVFVGACIQCISWAPPHVDDTSDSFGHFLAVATHNDVDLPRLDCAKTYVNSGLLQIWDFGDLSSTEPKFAFGIAHDYGTVWAFDWCPSGTRDVLPPLGQYKEPEFVSGFLRLGLLAIACSNGSAYIFSVPYPSSVKSSDKNVFKLTPVAELRLSRGQRDVFQATSISWSPQNGHETIMVGYSNGTVASYNLECDSPLLMEYEGGINIFYPFQDERPHSSTITDVKTFPSSVGAGLMSSVSPTGCEAAQRRGFVRINKHLSSTSAAFVPHWPALMLSGNETIVNQTVNELDFWGVGRRMGAVQKCCGCLHCGHMASFSPPVLKILTTHPAYSDFHKEPLAVFQMRPLVQKRPKQKNDNLQVKLEPLTYSDAVKSYALDFKLIKDLDKESVKQINRPRTQYPERFPFNDIPSMAFYPSQKHHRKLAVATHAGIIFILTDSITL